MFSTTLITEENARSFLPAVSGSALTVCDVFLGVYDVESDTACGVIAAEAVSGGLLSIHEIFVAESFRNQGAGHALLEFLKEVAREIGCLGLMCIYEEKDGEESDIQSRLLASSGFIKEGESLPVYMLNLSDINLPIVQNTTGAISISELSDPEWTDFTKEAEKADNPLWGREMYNDKISYVLLDSFGKVDCALLFSGGGQVINLEYAKMPGNRRSKGLDILMSCVYVSAKKSLPEDAKFRMQISDPASLMLLNGISGQKIQKTGELTTVYFDLPIIY